MTRAEAVEAIRNSKGRIFGAVFTKRTTGELRQGAFRTGVVRVKGELGSGPAYDPESKGLILVWDMQKSAYRTIPIEGLVRVAFAGKWEEVTDFPEPLTDTLHPEGL